MTLVKELAAVRSPNLVFSSVGDHSSLHRWLRGARRFDLWITYYGEQPGRCRAEADYYNERRGSKFQNLHFAYRHWRRILERYSAVLVLDDDVEISGSAISRLFEYRERHDLWVLQPAFSPLGKISWPVTEVDRRNVLRFTNFVEMTCPLFRRDKLDAFMDVYDPALVGWGCDWWFLETMGPDLRGRVAVVDAVTCVNPHDFLKGGREIDRLVPAQDRKANWEATRARYGLRQEEYGTQEFSAIRKHPFPRALARGTGAAVALWLAASRLPRAQGVLRRLRSGPAALRRAIGNLLGGRAL